MGFSAKNEEKANNNLNNDSDDDCIYKLSDNLLSGDNILNAPYDYDDSGKEPNPIAKSMSWMKTNMKLGMEKSDQTASDLITDGCNMGVKSLNRYLNQYKAAEERAKDITKRLINLEEQLAKDIRQYL